MARQIASKKSALFVTATGAFLVPFMASSINIALPSIGKEFGMDAVLLSWISTSYLLTTALFLVPFGRIADLYGRKRIFFSGFLLFTLASFFAAISHAPWPLIASRILQGIGGAMIFSTAAAILTSIFSEGERGKALGINVACVYMGTSLGPFLGGLLTERWGWRSLFGVTVPLGLWMLFAIFWKLKGEWAEARGEKFDRAGSILYGLTLAFILAGFTLLPQLLGAGFIGLGILGLAGFIWWEGKVKNPVLNLDLFRHNRVFALSNLAALIHYSATYGVAFLLSLYLQYIKGFSPFHAGWILVFQPAMQALFSPSAGRLSDRLEPRIVASLGMGLSVVGLSCFVFLKGNTPLWFIVTSLMILGLGFALFSSPNTNAVMGSVERKFYGVSAGTIATMRLVGQSLSMGLIIVVFNIYLGPVKITAAIYPHFLQSIKLVFILFAISCIGGIFASLGRGKIH
jgi:EmrB/QacA subfamily drug resistance transporter